MPRKARKEIRAMVCKEGEQLGSDVVAQYSATGIEGFREAVREGLLEVHTFGQTSVEALIEARFRGAYTGYAARTPPTCSRRL